MSDKKYTNLEMLIGDDKSQKIDNITTRPQTQPNAIDSTEIPQIGLDVRPEPPTKPQPLPPLQQVNQNNTQTNQVAHLEPSILTPNTHDTIIPDLKNEDRKETKKNIFSTIAILISAPLVAVMIIAFVFQSYEVSGPSMETTLQDRDRLIGYKLPITVAKATGQTFVPTRNDVVIFRKDELALDEGGSYLIKRVIGLPGDRVVVSDGTIKIYNDENPEGFEPDKTFDYGKVITYTAGEVDLVVPEGQVFVDGDNRPNSLDSRQFGPIETSTIKAVAKFRFSPISKFKNL